MARKKLILSIHLFIAVVSVVMRSLMRSLRILMSMAALRLCRVSFSNTNILFRNLLVKNLK